MNKKYLAYFALLAGWLCLCYWWYAEELFPRLHGPQEKSWPEYVEDLPFPLGFRWASDEPLAGKEFGELKESFRYLDTMNVMLIVRGYYFRDEAASSEQLETLAHGRIKNALRYLRMDESKVVTEVKPQEINADVRTNPFEAIRFEKLALSKVIKESEDTLEICFPLKDSLSLPGVCFERLAQWSKGHVKHREGTVHIIGTADASGIAEATDVAIERALVIKQMLLLGGWEEDRIRLSTGQRSHPLTLRNRCVIIYFD